LGRLARSAARAAMIASTLAAAAPASASTLFFPREIAEQTNALHSNNCFWGGPRGMDYAALPDPQPIQIPNLYPDKGSTYFPAQFNMPENSSLTIRGTYSRERYFSFTVANQLGNGSVGNGDYLRDVQIDPDPGSVNPFRQSPNDRTPTGQTYTLRVLRGPAPTSNRPANTIYTTSTSATSPIRVAMRNYVPDQGLGGTGGVDLPTVTLTLQDGTTITDPAAVCTTLGANKNSTPTGFPEATYAGLIAGSSDPVNAPARPTPEFERFWNNAYSILGLFSPDPVSRINTYGTGNPKRVNDDGGFATNPDTAFVSTALSLNFGKVIVMKVKSPTYAKTRPEAAIWDPTDTQVRYWSACTAEGPVSGRGADCAYDQQTPVDDDGNWTIVVSRPEDRPANANTVCGVKWLDFGLGEGYATADGGPTNNSGYVARDYLGVLYMRYMAANPNWLQNPKYRTGPTAADPYNHLADWMGEYTPAASYTSKAAYEAQGCNGPRLASGSSAPNAGSFALEWDGVTNALPQLYTLQHKSVYGGDWSTVASDLTSPDYTFPADSPEGEGTWTYRVAAIDVSSSETTPSGGDFGPESDPIQVDATAPSLSVTCPALLLLHGTGSATTTASDEESGLASDPSGTTAIDASTVGPKTITATAIDNAGNSTTESCTTQVVYAYSGLLQPVNVDGSSIFKLGSTVPIKFTLTDVASAPASGAIAHLYLAKVTNSIEGSLVEAASTSAADTGNTFRETTPGFYQFNLATKGLTVGTYSVKVVLDDGSSYPLYISLK
jgi:hypothetical protein